MGFTGHPGTGKTTVALKTAEIVHRRGDVHTSHAVGVTRDDLAGQYIGDTAPETNALDRARPRQADRVFANALGGGAMTSLDELTPISAADIRASRVFGAAKDSATQ